jgi:hypothetical protein
MRAISSAGCTVQPGTRLPSMCCIQWMCSHSAKVFHIHVCWEAAAVPLEWAVLHVLPVCLVLTVLPLPLPYHHTGQRHVRPGAPGAAGGGQRPQEPRPGPDGEYSINKQGCCCSWLLEWCACTTRLDTAMHVRVAFHSTCLLSGYLNYLARHAALVSDEVLLFLLHTVLM